MPHRITLFCALLVVFGSSLHSQQQRQLIQESQPAGQRIALVIGNGSYAMAPLKNPVNDARDVTEALRLVGFEVTYKENLNQKDMKVAIRAFGKSIKGSAVGLFYYAGHGVQVNGFNYLVPVDATVESEEEVEYECVEVGFVLAQMESAGNPMNIVILDACRNNPFARSLRSASRGLASMNAPSGTLIAYSTAPGSVASDGESRNGIYTQELLRYLKTPDLSVEEFFKKVRTSVRSSTQGKQTPWETSSLVGSFYFIATDNKRDNVVQDPTASTIKGNKNNSQPQENRSPSWQMVGVWRANVSELGNTLEITFSVNADGTASYLVRDKEGHTGQEYARWQYSDGILYERFSNGASGRGSVEWIDSDTFDLTIIDNGTPAYSGMKRHYRRVK